MTVASTTEEIQTLLEGGRVVVSCGLRLLDSSDVETEDISDSLVGGWVEHNSFANVHGTCNISLSRELDWTTERLQPYMTVSDDTYTLTRNLGVYVLSTPEAPLGESPITYTVEGYDKLKLLDRPVGDTYVVTSGTAYLTAVEAAIADAGVSGIGVMLDSTAIATTLSADMVWILDANNYTWLRVVNDLLKAIGYRGIFVNADGYFCSVPYQTPSERGAMWSFDLTNTSAQTVAPDRISRKDRFTDTNWYRFILDGDTQPTEGVGQYTVAVDPGFRATGGTITYDGHDVIHTFNSSGTFTCEGADISLTVLRVGAGGAGGGAGTSGAGGGGEGGEVLATTETISVGAHAVTIGNGGTAGASTPAKGGDGGDTTFNSVTASGGGGGGSSDAPNQDATGGGAGADESTDGASSEGHSFTGGDAKVVASNGAGGGGAGAGEDGSIATGTGLGDGAGGAGGDGVASTITGASVVYGGAGGGGLCSVLGGTAGAGGAGGGGAGGKGAAGTSGTANLGGGGGGGGRSVGVANRAGGAGGKGVVIIRYTPPMLWKSVQPLYVENQTALEAQGDSIVENDTLSKHSIMITASPMPIFGHFDIVQYDDPQTGALTYRCQVARWQLPLDSSDMELDLEVVS